MRKFLSVFGTSFVRVKVPVPVSVSGFDGIVDRVASVGNCDREKIENTQGCRDRNGRELDGVKMTGGQKPIRRVWSKTKTSKRDASTRPAVSRRAFAVDDTGAHKRNILFSHRPPAEG